MPKLVPQNEKAASTINAQPKDLSKNSVQLIMMYDLCGWKQGRIAEEIGMTQPRVSVIMSSPLYRSQRQLRFDEMKSKAVAPLVEDASKGDPIARIFRENAELCAQKKVDLALSAESEFVQSASANDVLEYAGYKREQKKTSISVMVTDKVADRFERVLKMQIEEQS